MPDRRTGFRHEAKGSEIAEAAPARGGPAIDSTLAYLHARGLDVEPGDLSPMLREALDTMHRTLYPVDPAADLPAAETAALRRGGFLVTPAEAEHGGALARTAAEYAAILETSLAAGDTARLLGVDPSRIRQLLAARRIYGLQVKGAWRIPLFQFDRNRLLPGLEEVVPRLTASLHPVAVYRWFTTENPDLAPEDLDRALSPREWLLAGYPPAAVAELAADLDSL
jgi:hypothetical protein